MKNLIKIALLFVICIQCVIFSGCFFLAAKRAESTEIDRIEVSKNNEPNETSVTDENINKRGWISNETGANLRSEASKGAQITDVIKDRTEITVMSIQGKWAYISVGGKTGYCLIDYISYDEPEEIIPEPDEEFIKFFVENYAEDEFIVGNFLNDCTDMVLIEEGIINEVESYYVYQVNGINTVDEAKTLMLNYFTKEHYNKLDYNQLYEKDGILYYRATYEARGYMYFNYIGMKKISDGVYNVTAATDVEPDIHYTWRFIYEDGGYKFDGWI